MNDVWALKVIGKHIRDHRQTLGHSLQGFATSVGLGAQTIRFFEKGHRWPGEEVLGKIEQGLGWWPGSITHFRDQALAAPDLDAATRTLHGLAQNSPPTTEVEA